MKTTKVLSVDWDFFMDCGCIHGVLEEPAYRGNSWRRRKLDWMKEGKTLESQVPFTGPTPQEFISHFDFRNTKFLSVVESHTSIVDGMCSLEKGKLEILNIDAHHDVAYSNRDILDYANGVGYNCGSWGGFLMWKRRVSKWTQVYPEWRYETGKCTDTLGFAASTATKFKVKFEIRTLDAVKFSPDLCFICRSSPWTPPDYDEKFHELCKAITVAGEFVVDNAEKDFRFPRE